MRFLLPLLTAIFLLATECGTGTNHISKIENALRTEYGRSASKKMNLIDRMGEVIRPDRKGNVRLSFYRNLISIRVHRKSHHGNSSPAVGRIRIFVS